MLTAPCSLDGGGMRSEGPPQPYYGLASPARLDALIAASHRLVSLPAFTSLEDEHNFSLRSSGRFRPAVPRTLTIRAARTGSALSWGSCLHRRAGLPATGQDSPVCPVSPCKVSMSPSSPHISQPEDWS